MGLWVSVREYLYDVGLWVSERDDLDTLLRREETKGMLVGRFVCGMTRLLPHPHSREQDAEG